MLFALASAFGTPLKVDEPTANLTRPSVARVLVEVDASKIYKERIWIGNEKEGFYQRVVLENMPKYCQFCYKMGHAMEDCYVKAPPVKEGHDDTVLKNNSKAILSKKAEVAQKEPVAKSVQQKYVPKIGVIEVEKGKAIQIESNSLKTTADIETSPSKSLPSQSIEVGSMVDAAVGNARGVCPGLTCVTNTEVNSIPSNSSGSPGVVIPDDQTVNSTCTRDDRAPLSPSLQEEERNKALTFSSAPPCPTKDGSTRPLASYGFAHTDEESGETEVLEEEEEEEDEDFEEEPDYSTRMRNYDFYAYSSLKKGFRTGRLMGSSRR